jgi:glucose/arabinose dehydrogenase
MHSSYYLYCVAALALFSCGDNQSEKKAENAGKADTVAAVNQQAVKLPAPFASPSVNNFCKVIGWSRADAGERKPTAPAGFQVVKFADSLNNPRWIYVAGNGDIFVSEASTQAGAVKKIKGALSGMSKSQNIGNSANRITLFRDTNGDGIPDFRSVFLTGLHQPCSLLEKPFMLPIPMGSWPIPTNTGKRK